jgi:hypothetical protein
VIYKYFFSALLSLDLFAASWGMAAAQSAVAAKTSVFSSPVKPMGEVSIDELVKRPANASPVGRPVEMPKHRLPHGGLTTAPPAKPVLDHLPIMTPNVGVSSAFLGIKGFVGIHSHDNVTAYGFEFEPPDQGLAVNNNVAAEISSLVLRFFNATTGAPLSPPIALSAFLMSGDNTCDDSQAFYDSTSQRWFFLNIACSSEPGKVEGIDVAVSKASDPLGSYYIYHIPSATSDLPGCGGVDCYTDYPKAGYDANGFYISVNLYNATAYDFVRAATYAISKAQIESGASVTPVRLLYPLGDSFVLQPSVPAPGEPYETAANGTEYLLEARGMSDLSHNIRVWAISNTNTLNTSSPTLVVNFTDVVAEPYGPAVLATEPNVVGPNCRSHGVTSAPLIDGRYWTFQATVHKAEGKLYAALPTGVNDGNGLPRDIIAWFVLTPSVDSSGVPSASIVSQGYVIPPNGYSLLNPAFALRNSGVGALGFSITNKSALVTGGFPSAAFIRFNGTNTTGKITVSGRGLTSDDGFTGCDAAGHAGIWGDYGAATVDAATGYLYTVNENISGRRGKLTNWGTFITQLH